MDKEKTVFDGRDHKSRRWLIIARPYNNQVIVEFCCWNANGKSKALNMTSAWTDGEWDLSRPWLPTSPRPVPEAILEAVERQLKQVVGRG